MEPAHSADTPLWYYLDQNQAPCGPLPITEIKALVEKGDLPADVQVCLAGKERWHSLGIALLPPLPVSHAKRKTSSRSGSVQEYRRTCKRCGKVWHSLIEREENIQKEMKGDNCASVIHCCNPEVGAQSRRNVAAHDSELSRLRTCPECQSAHYREEILDRDTPAAE